MIKASFKCSTYSYFILLKHPSILSAILNPSCSSSSHVSSHYNKHYLKGCISFSHKGAYVNIYVSALSGSESSPPHEGNTHVSITKQRNSSPIQLPKLLVSKLVWRRWWNWWSWLMGRFHSCHLWVVVYISYCSTFGMMGVAKEVTDSCRSHHLGGQITKSALLWRGLETIEDI